MEVPDGLHPMQYGLHILENELGWPAKGNCELMADCLTSIQKSKRLTAVQAYRYMLRAIKLAKEQGITVDIWFFKYGQYSTIRPLEHIHEYVKTDWEAVRKHQSSPEFDAAWKEMQEKCAKAFGIPIKRK